MYMTSTQPDFISNSLEPWMIKERENILPSVTASAGCPMQRRIKATSERENPNVTMNENKESRIKVPSREKKEEQKKGTNKVFHPFSRVIIMLLSSFNFSLRGLDYLFVFEPRLGWITANTISTLGGRWFRDSRVINAILRPVSFLLGRLIDHTRPFLIYNRAPRQVRPPPPLNFGISSNVDERSRISSSPLFHSFFFFFFLFLSFPSLLPPSNTGIWQFNGGSRASRISDTLVPVSSHRTF